jgi:hypothetical protein
MTDLLDYVDRNGFNAEDSGPVVLQREGVDEQTVFSSENLRPMALRGLAIRAGPIKRKVTGCRNFGASALRKENACQPKGRVQMVPEESLPIIGHPFSLSTTNPLLFFFPVVASALAVAIFSPARTERPIFTPLRLVAEGWGKTCRFERAQL